MFKQLMLISALGSSLLLSSMQVSADEQTQKTEKMTEQTKTKIRDQVYGWQMMTPQERTEFHAKMRAMKTDEERAAFRAEHHKRMLERAKERGVKLPDEMPMDGRGMGQGMRPGMGNSSENK